jgi:hypothetical protein
MRRSARKISSTKQDHHKQQVESEKMKSKVLFNILVISTLLLSALPAASAAPDRIAGAQVLQAAGEMVLAQDLDEMGWPMPEKPIPYHKSGRVSTANNYTTQVEIAGENGLLELATISGVDAMVADGLDPLIGSYTLVGWDHLLRSSNSTDAFAMETFSITTEEAGAGIFPEPSSLNFYGGDRSTDIAAGDLNFDGRAEQIAAWLDASNQVNFWIGQLPASVGNSGSAPAAVVSGHTGNTIDLLVRGSDQALWHCEYDVVSGSCAWENGGGGGMLLTAPAVVSPAVGVFEVYAILANNLVYKRTWNGSWPSAWVLVDDPSYWEPLDSLLPIPDLAAPAVIYRGGKVDLFRLGPDNTLRWRHFNGIQWESWYNLGGMLASGPAAIPLSLDSMQVFARGADDALWTRTYSGSWGAWKRVELNGMPEGTAIASSPTAVSPSAGQIDVYVRGSDNHLWKVHYNGSTWGSWTGGGDGEGLLASAVGVALFDGGTYLFAQNDLSGLQVNAGSGWQDFPAGIPISTTTNTGLTGIRRELGDFKDYSLDVETGRFWGDGRSQIVLGYLSAARELNIVLMDTSLDKEDRGFTPVKVNTGDLIISTGADIAAFRIATGNFLGGEIDDISVVYFTGTTYYVKILRFNRTTRQLEIVKETSQSKPGTSESFNGTLEIVSGDFDANGQANFAINATWFKDGGLFYNDYYYFMTRIYRVDDQGVLQAYYYENYKTVDVYYYNVNRNRVSMASAAGDVNGDGKDEIIRTWPTGFSGSGNDSFKRKGQVIRWKSWVNGADGFDVQDLEDSTRGPTSRSYGDRMAVGDFDRDLTGEILWDVGVGTSTPTTRHHVYKIDPADSKYKRIIAQGEVWHWMPRLVTADFSGRGIRVGPPSYRMQTKMTSPLVLLNLPPMHRDIINGEVINTNHTATAVHKTSETETEKSKTESKRDWSLSTGVEAGVGAAGHKVTTSLEYTHGENFAKSTTEIESYELAVTTTADIYDQVIFNGTDYGVWEYPVLGVEVDDESENGPPTISVVFPLVTTTNQPTSRSGHLTCDENFYAPSHQVYNIWSYGAIGSPPFEDLDDLIMSQQTSGGSQIHLKMEDLTEEERTKSFHNQINTGLEYKYENELKIPLIGKAYDVSFRAYAKGSYRHENIGTLGTTYVEATEVTIDLPSDGTFNVETSLYWAAAGYLVADYRTTPFTSWPWYLYDRPDPAFLLPWYGFPDPDKPVQPPCGADRKHFSHDIKLEPAYVQNGEMVKITATVRNFSSKTPAGSVVVRFYLGDPAGGSAIGQCSISGSILTRLNGPQQCSIDWEVAGAYGTEKIFAVIDPEDSIAEVHDENDLINNNIGYGLLYAAQADYFDPGRQAHDQVYQSIVHENAPGLGFSLHLPTNNRSETFRYELLPIAGYESGVVGRPIHVMAFPGGSEEPDQDHVYGSTPAILIASYRDGDLLPGMAEADLKIFRLGDQGWVEAACQGYETVRFPDDNLVAAPVCQTGAFALATTPPSVHKPQASFTASPLAGNAPLKVQFTDLSTNDPTSWEWDFGDGTRGYDQNPLHTYTRGGIFTVTLTARNGLGSDVLTKTAYINVKGGIYLPVIVR